MLDYLVKKESRVRFGDGVTSLGAIFDFSTLRSESNLCSDLLPLVYRLYPNERQGGDENGGGMWRSTASVVA